MWPWYPFELSFDGSVYHYSITLSVISLIERRRRKRGGYKMRQESQRLKLEEFTKRIGYTSILEIICICIFPFIIQWLKLLTCIQFKFTLNYQLYTLVLIDYFIIFIPMLLILTFFSSYINLIVISCYLICLLWTILPNIHRYHYVYNLNNLSLNNLIIYSRSTIYIISCIMIYCIDLPICPRRFAKSEVYGIGLMDIGTGLFIVASSISNCKIIWSMSIDYNNNGKEFFPCLLYSLLPCLGLGVIRTLFIQLFNYCQNITEYGIYWNFFYTLTIIRGFSLLFTTKNSLSNYILNLSIKKQLLFYLILSCICLLLSEYLPIVIYPKYFQLKWQFNSTSLLYIEENRVHSIWMANFEGIQSIFGYASIYFCSIAIFTLTRIYLLVNDHHHHHHHNNNNNNNNNSNNNNKEKIVKGNYFSPLISLLNHLFLFYCLIIFIGFICIHLLGGYSMISRRFANINYILFIIIITLICILIPLSIFSLLIKFQSNFFFHSNYSLFCLIIDKKGMLYFLISNIFTGFLNILRLNALNFLPDQEVNNFNFLTGTYDNLTWYSSLLQFLILFLYTTLSIVCVVIVYHLCKSSSRNELNNHLK
ncbi:unnamed protein product [Heterobilharzia americana]|nr:unnamed protein product [Heterobilharzia americana]